jgi:hypothetical protein
VNTPIAALAGALLVSAAAAGSTSHGEKEIPVTPAMRDAAHQAVARAMRDPASAQFGELLVAFEDKKHNQVDVCGQVNGRNGFGGYTGMQYFHVALMDLHSNRKGSDGHLWFGMAAFDNGREMLFFRTYPVCYMPAWR